MSHGFPQKEQEPTGAEPRVRDPESRRYGVMFGHGYPPRPDVRGTVIGQERCMNRVSRQILAAAIIS